MTTRELHERYGLLAKSGYYLNEPNPFHYDTLYWVGYNTLRIDEDLSGLDAIAVGLSDSKDLASNNHHFLVFRVPSNITDDILDGSISVREAYDKHSDDIVFIVEQSAYSYSPYDTMVLSRKDVPSVYVEELEKEKCKAQKPR